MKAEKKATPSKSELARAAERESSRGERIAGLAKEAKMWREFSAGCKPGRHVYEYFGLSARKSGGPLCVDMDEITCEAWRAFAATMVASAECRLREILG